MNPFTLPTPPPALVPELITYRDRVAAFVGELSSLIAALDPSQVPVIRAEESIGRQKGQEEEASSLVRTRSSQKAKLPTDSKNRTRKATEDEMALYSAVASMPGEFRNIDLTRWLSEHHPDLARRIEKSTGRLSVFITKLKERGWVEFVRKDGLAVFNRRTSAFKAPVSDSVRNWESFKFGTLGIKPSTPTEE